MIVPATSETPRVLRGAFFLKATGSLKMGNSVPESGALPFARTSPQMRWSRLERRLWRAISENQAEAWGNPFNMRDL
jgi:hypothetical protein